MTIKAIGKLLRVPCKNYGIFIVLLLASLSVMAQKQGQARIDSIYDYLKTHTQNDTNKVNALCDIAFTYYGINPQTGVDIGKKALSIAQDLNFKPGIAKSYRFIGANLSGLSRYTEAIEHYSKALVVEESLKNKKGMGSNFVNIGLIYTNQSDYSKALDYFFKALKLFETIDYKKGLSNCYGNIVLVYMELANYEKGFEFAEKALALDEEMGNEYGQARHIGNMGLMLTYKNELDKAMEYYNRALEKFTKVGDKRGVANINGNIAGCYLKKLQFDKAVAHIQISIADYEELDAKKDVAINYINLGNAYLEMHKTNYVSRIKVQNKLEAAKEYALKAISIAKSSGELYIERDARKQLYEIEKLKGNTVKALQDFELYINLRDSITGKEKSNEITRKEMMFEFEIKLAADSIKNAAEMQVQQVQIEAQKAKLQVEITKRNGLIVGVVALIGFLVFIFSRLRITRRQNEVIRTQKEFVELQRNSITAQKRIVDEKNREIFDSIIYAKRLQEAILPSNKLLNKYLPNSYVFYKPKDIVAGDFYWMDTFPKDENGQFFKPADLDCNPEDLILFAVADCTGHGVPGAMISIFCSNALNRAIKEFYLIDPGNILDKVRSLVIQTFEKSDIEVRDGMDISLCVLNTKTNELLWAGANNPLWLVRDNKMIEYKPDRQPIGKYDNPTSFTTHKIQLQSGDKFYIFSDGLADQFGGEKGKKLKTGKLRELIMAQQSNSMQMQYDIMDKFFEMWKGDYEQVDDICVIGVSI